MQMLKHIIAYILSDNDYVDTAMGFFTGFFTSAPVFLFVPIEDMLIKMTLSVVTALLGGFFGLIGKNMAQRWLKKRKKDEPKD